MLQPPSLIQLYYLKQMMSTFHTYGKNKNKQLVPVYGQEAKIEFQGETFKLPPVIDGDKLLSEWPVFRRALLYEKEAVCNVFKKPIKSPTFLQQFQGIQTSDAYGGTFPEMFKLINMVLTLPVWTVTAERSSRQII